MAIAGLSTKITEYHREGVKVFISEFGGYNNKRLLSLFPGSSQAINSGWVMRNTAVRKAQTDLWFLKEAPIF